LTLLLLFFSQEVDNKFLVVLDKIIRQALRPQVVTEILPPPRVKSIK